MRNKLITILSALLLLFLLFPNSSLAMTSAADTVIVIEPYPGSNPDPEGPRQPLSVPISASYESLLSSILLTFTSNLGEIEVEVLNTISGYYDSGFIDTQYLSAVIPISGGPGHYIILFTLPSGQQYKGEFDI